MNLEKQTEWFIVKDELAGKVVIKTDDMAQTPICIIATPSGRDWMNNKRWYDNSIKKAKKIQQLPAIINAASKLFEQEEMIRYTSPDKLHDLKMDKAFIDLKSAILKALS